MAGSGTFTVNLNLPGFASIVTGVGACIVAALDQTPTGAPCRQCLLLPTSLIPWDNCGPCPCGPEETPGCCSGQVGLAITNVYGSSRFPTPSAGETWAHCNPRYWVARVLASVTRCVPSMEQDGSPPSCEDELIAAIILENDRTATRQAIACCLQALHVSTPVRISQWSLGNSQTVGELGACAGSETEFWIGVQACPCPG